MYAITPRMIDDFGLMRVVDDFMDPWTMSMRHPMQFMDGTVGQAGRIGDSEVQNTDKEFRVRLDLRHYKPEEVKITSDNERVTIHAKHEEKQDNHGYVAREMTRIYKLPGDVDPKSVTSTMNSNGVLSVKAQKKALEAPKETAMPIQFTK